MLTAFAIYYFILEINLSSPVTGISNFLFLILLASIMDYGIWKLGDS